MFLQRNTNMRGLRRRGRQRVSNKTTFLTLWIYNISYVFVFPVWRARLRACNVVFISLCTHVVYHHQCVIVYKSKTLLLFSPDESNIFTHTHKKMPIKMFIFLNAKRILGLRHLRSKIDCMHRKHVSVKFSVSAATYHSNHSCSQCLELCRVWVSKIGCECLVQTK